MFITDNKYTMNAKNNKWLVVNRGVMLNEVIEPVIVALDPYFEKAQLKAYVTSGERTSLMQLEIIQQYAKRYKIDSEYPELMDCQPMDKVIVNGERFYTWQHGWSRLLNIGVIINPPLPARCLFDYWRSGINKKGKTIGYSPHYWGKAFDIGGNTDGVDNETEVIKQALNDKVPGLKGFLIERKNNCLHCDVRPVNLNLTANI